MKFSGKLALETCKVFLVRKQTQKALKLPVSDETITYYEQLLPQLSASDTKDDVTRKAKGLTQSLEPVYRRIRNDAAAEYLSAVKRCLFADTYEVAPLEEAKRRMDYFASLDKSLDTTKIPWESLPSEVAVPVLHSVAKVDHG